MKKKPKKRQWAFRSAGAEQGKSTLMAAIARAPVMVVDTDNRFDAVEALVDGEVLYATQARNISDLAEELLDLFDKHHYKTLMWDSLTKLYSIHARLPWMAARAGKIKNRASAMIDKSNAMTVARDLAILGTDCFYAWHTTSGVDGTGKLETRDMISATEHSRLMTSINVTLECMAENGQYGVTVVSARDFGGRKANTGFTIWDRPGNYWKGTADYLERLMYTSFASADEACRWAIEELGQGEIGEMRGEYDHLKEKIQPPSAAVMWVVWIQHIDEINAAKAEDKVANTEFQPEEAESALAEALAVPPDNGDLNAVPGEGAVAEAVESPGRNEVDQLAVLRKSLEEHEALSLGHVMFAAAEARPDLGRPDELLKALDAFDDLPDGYNATLDQRITIGGGETIYDWLVGLERLPVLE